MDVTVGLLMIALGVGLVGSSARVASYLNAEVGGRGVPVFRIVRRWMTSRWYVVAFGLGAGAVGGVMLFASTSLPLGAAGSSKMCVVPRL